MKVEINLSDNKAGVAEKINMYKDDVEKLVQFLPWLEKKAGEDLFNTYIPDQATAGTMHVPVYDSTLLNFIKTAQKTKFMNKNYVYAYTRKRMRTAEDELNVISNTQIMEIEVLGDILSKYVMKGMIKSTLWTEGIRTGVFYQDVKKMKELIEYWTVPMNR